MTISKGFRFIAVGGALVVLAAALVSAGSALAAKGGNGHGHGGFGTVPTCSVTPENVPLDTGYTINGVGFTVDSVAVRVETAAGTILAGATVSPDGSFSVSLWAGAPGAYTVTVENPGNHSKTVLATCSFTVTS